PPQTRTIERELTQATIMLGRQAIRQTDPDYFPLAVASHILGGGSSSRLYGRVRDEGGLAYSVYAYTNPSKYGASFVVGAQTRNSEAKRVVEILREELARMTREPVTERELALAKDYLIGSFPLRLDTTGKVADFIVAVEELGLGLDYADRYKARIARVTAADVQRVAEAYLLPDNRVLGQFVPTAQPQRAQIPAVPDVRAALEGYRGGAALATGEAFDPSPQNIEARLQRRTLANGVRVALLPKRTRGATVVAKLDLHWGSEETTRGRSTACTLAGEMLMRGRTGHTRAELRDAFERMKATVRVNAGGATLETRREHLADAITLLAEVLREPAFPASEFEELKRSSLTSAEAQRSDPSAVASEELRRHLHPYPKGHWYYEQSLEERIAALQAATLEDARACHRELLGATGADFAAVGDFDPAQLGKLVEELFGDWKNPAPYARIEKRYFERPALERELHTPDKANAVLRAGLNLRMRDDDPDFPALVLANQLLGGSSSARLPERIREKEGLSYSTYTWFSASPLDDAANFWVSAIFAPQNKERVELAVREELQRALREGFGADEVAAAKKGLLEARYLARTQDAALAERLARYSFVGRTFAWDIEFERRIAALTPGEVRDALRRHLALERLAVTKAGDFK
ncbi:MAG: M16 family metallopeptidase, partial [Burkholderiales bacterium]